jgi:DNA polymerase III delta prime subunit
MSFTLNTKHLHHAYLVEGERDLIMPEVLDFLYAEKLTAANSPDLHILEFDSMGIDDAHALRREQQMKGAEGNKKFFIVAFNIMTSEAQNALLKTLEEPTEDTHFFLITRTKETLIPTVRSRVQLVGEKRLLKGSKVGDEFLDADIPERLLRVEKFTKVKADDKSEAKDAARDFLSHLESALHARLATKKEYAASLEDVITAKRYLSDRAPSLKILLEHLALTIPLK